MRTTKTTTRKEGNKMRHLIRLKYTDGKELYIIRENFDFEANDDGVLESYELTNENLKFPYIIKNYVVEKETEKAILVSVNNKKYWVPKSQCEVIDNFLVVNDFVINNDSVDTIEHQIIDGRRGELIAELRNWFFDQMKQRGYEPDEETFQNRIIAIEKKLGNRFESFDNINQIIEKLK